jgi:putative DNA primase/helicase
MTAEDVSKIVGGAMAVESLPSARKRRRRASLGVPDARLPNIHVLPGEMPRIVNEAERALINSGQHIYQRGGMLVRPYLARVPAANGRETSSYRMARPTVRNLQELCTGAANFLRVDGRSGDLNRIDCSYEVAHALDGREGMWKFPPLRGVITSPTLRGDGSILDKPGYDRQSALLFDPCGVLFPGIPKEPSRDDALAAMRVIKDELLSGYPFVDRESAAVALSGILTLPVRCALGTVPLHAFTAPAPGTGKTHVVDLICMHGTGQPAAVISQSRQEEETDKRIASSILAGDAVISIDNCTAALGSSLLCVAVTQETIRIRVLGQSSNVEVPNNAMFFATGNHLEVGDDMSRRVLLCSLDAQVERPELRTFVDDPIDLLRANRGRYVVAALTCLQAFHVAGRPEMQAPLGSFADWSLMVRNALLWLGEADPAGTMEKARAADAKLRALAAVMDQWGSIPVLMERRKTAAEIIHVASEEEPFGGAGLRFRYGDLRDALLVIAAEGSTGISTRRLGKWLMANQGRICGGRRIVQAGTHGGVALWQLELIKRP